MEEKDLTEKQKEWLEASKRIGGGPLTKTARDTLEKLFAEMLPKEQQDLYEYIQENFTQEEDDENQKPDPTTLMEKRVWEKPSEKLLKAFGSSQTVRPPSEPADEK